MRFLRVLPAALLVLIVPAAAASATEEPTGPVDCGVFEGVVCQGWFTDDAGVVDDDQRVEDAIDRVVGRYGNEIAAVIVTDSRGQSPRDFAFGLGNAWGVGGPGQDGVVVLVALDERRTEVVPGAGLEMSDTRAESIAGAANSFFGVGDFEGGMLAIVGSLEQELAALGTATAPAPVDTPVTPQPASDGGNVGWVVLILAAGIGVVGAGAGYVSNRRTKHKRIADRRTELINGDLGALEPAGHELPQFEEYARPPPATAPDVGTSAP